MHVLIPALHRPVKPTGVCRHAANLALCLAEVDRVSRITVLIGEWQRDYFMRSFDFESAKIQVVSVDIENSSLSRNRWFLLGLPKLVGQLQPDVVHMSFPLPFVRQWLQAPVVVSTIHDLYPYECPENFGYPQVWFNQAFLRQCVNHSDGLACVSKGTLKALVDYFPKARHTRRTAAIYNVVDFAGIASKFPRQLGSDSFGPFLMAVAQHRKNKNLDLLVRAYGTLLNTDRLRPNTRLLLVGSAGPETERLTDLIKTLKLSSRIMFLSGLEDGELRWLYEQASLFVIPSSTEGFCLPLVEALTLSCPSVCSDIPIFREVGSSQCRYFQLGQRALHNLTEAIASELSQTSGSKSSIDSRFSRKEISRQLLDFYELSQQT